MKQPLSLLLWLAVALAGAVACFTPTLHRGEQTSPACVLLAARCACAIGCRCHSKWIAARVPALDDRRAGLRVAKSWPMLPLCSAI